jgi:hypothetical protein
VDSIFDHAAERRMHRLHFVVCAHQQTATVPLSLRKYVDLLANFYYFLTNDPGIPIIRCAASP